MSKVVTGMIRMSYVALMLPRVDKNSGVEKYTVTCLLPKTDIKTKALIDQAIANAIEQGKQNKWNGLVPPQIPTPIHDGDGVKADGSPYGAECKGHWVFTASTNANPAMPKPEILDAQGMPIMNASEVYSGMYGRVSVTFAPYFNAGKKGIGCYLNHVQKLQDGDPLAGAKASAAEDFGTMPVATPQAPTTVAAPTQYAQTPTTTPQHPQYAPPVAAAPQTPTTAPNYNVNAPAVDPITGQPLSGGVMGI